MLSQTDVAWIKAAVEALDYTVYDQTVPSTPPREYVVIYPGESVSPLERAGQVQVRERQVWRLLCVSRSLAVLRRMTVVVCDRFTGARLGTTGPVIVEDEVGPEITEGSDADRRYSQTVIFSHHQSRNRRTTS